MDPINDNRIRRSRWLLVLAICTFISSGTQFLTYFFLSFSTSYLPAMLDMYKEMGMQQEVLDIFQQMLDVPGWQFLLLSLGFATAVVGAALMLKLNKIGFHLYVIAQLWIFAMDNLVIKGALSMKGWDIASTVMLIVLYALLLKEVLMQKNNQEGKYTDYEEVDDNNIKDEEEDDDDE